MLANRVRTIKLTQALSNVMTKHLVTDAVLGLELDFADAQHNPVGSISPQTTLQLASFKVTDVIIL